MSTDIKLKHISRRRKFPTFNRSTTPPPLQQVEVDFFQAVMGNDSDVHASPENVQAALCLLKRCVRGNWPAEFDDVVTDDVSVQTEPYLKAIVTGQKVADAFRIHGGLSIVRLIKQLQADRVFKDDEDLPSNLSAQRLVFNTIGWISMLYQPFRGLTRTSGSNNFKIAVQSRQSSLKSSVPAEKAERPLDELLRACAGMFSSRSQIQKDERNGSQDHLEHKIQVSYLNAHVMKTLTNMEFIWVDSISAHLDFDPTTPSVSIFRCPSFCKLHQSEESILAKLNNLSVANRVYILEPQWNPSVEDQAIGRVLRLGQDKQVCVIRYVTSGTIEESVRSRQLMKIQLAQEGGLQELSKIIKSTVFTEVPMADPQAK